MGLFTKLFDKIKSQKSISEKIALANSDKISASQTQFDQGLKQSANSLKETIDLITKKYLKIDEDLIENIHEALLTYDIGTSASTKILNSIVEEIKYQRIKDPKLIKSIIIDKLFVYYIQDTLITTQLELKPNKTNVILVIGVNGVGKTTTIAKLASLLKKRQLKVSLIAADTFRAGAVDQLQTWATRLDLPITIPDKAGQDPASVIFKGCKTAFENHDDVVLCDTSGRLQNKVNLMNELRKIEQIIKKFDADQPVETLLVLDATTGQSGIIQAKAFREVCKLTGIILTKMDSTSKGGIVLSIKDVFNLPVKYLGFGEKIEDLSVFDLEKFINGLTQGIKL